MQRVSGDCDYVVVSSGYEGRLWGMELRKTPEVNEYLSESSAQAENQEVDFRVTGDLFEDLRCLLIKGDDDARRFGDQTESDLSGVVEGMKALGRRSFVVFRGWRDLPANLLLGRAVVSMGYFACPGLVEVCQFPLGGPKSCLALIYDGESG
ncbi:MAG: hypothetical protein ACYCOU_14045 [Sulfobacillus sp.]